MKVTKNQIRKIISEQHRGGFIFPKGSLPTFPESAEKDEEEKEVIEEEDLEEVRMLKLTRSMIRKILSEAMNLQRSSMLPKDHVDGQPWSGTLEDLAKVQGAAWGHGKLVNPKGWSDDVKRAGRFTAGKEKSVFESRNMVKESVMKERYGEIENLVLATVEDDPGIPGNELASKVTAQHSRMFDAMQPVSKEEEFSVLDVLIDEMDIFFDDEGDGFYIAGSAEAGDVIAQMQDEEDRFFDIGARTREMMKRR